MASSPLRLSPQRERAPPPRSRAAHAWWWISVILAIAAPLCASDSIGYTETWSAFNRYQSWLLGFAASNLLHVPSPADGPLNYTRFDQQLTAWHARMGAVNDRIIQMMVVGKMENADVGLEFEFNRQAGANLREVKGHFSYKRDLSMILYFLLSAAVYFSESVPLALVVANLNLFNFAVCLRLKGLSDVMTKAVEQLQDVQQDLLLLPMEKQPAALQQQAFCLQKLQGVIESWAGTQFGFSITLPVINALTLSISIMGSLAAATTVRSLHVIVYGFWPSLPRISVASLMHSVLYFGSRQSTVEDAAAMLDRQQQQQPQQQQQRQKQA